jgi:glutamate synthase domain-containing protein 1
VQYRLLYQKTEKDGKRMNGTKIIDSMRPMHDRSNGLGGGFAAYGIYPEYKDFYALHIFYNDNIARNNCEKFLKDSFEIVRSENIPTRKHKKITDEPLIWRYFVSPLSSVLSRMQLDEKEYTS